MVRSNVVRVIAERALIPLNSLLLFFLVFETRIMLPGWLQVFGRMHPLALHFPIVLILLYAVMVLFFPSRLKKEHWYVSATDALLLGAAITSSITALMGFALSGGEDYDPDALSLHKWTGVIIPFLLYIIYLLRNSVLKNINVTRAVALGLTVVVSIAGHHGAVITHGENFILAPLTPVNQRVIPAFEDAFVYADMVEPILENKCFSCHNANKSKGELVMDTRELFMKGGKEGAPWDTTRNDLGILMQRVHMPLDEKKHMPPKGKPQLTDDEIFVLQEWIKRGSNFETKFVDLLPGDTLYVIGKNQLRSGSDEHYDFAAADEKTVTGLNNNYRVIAPVAAESPALAATFYNKATFKIELVNELAPINNNIVEINLAGMPVKDEDLAAMKQFKNLRKLNLNFTDVTGKTLEQLKAIPELKMLSLSGTTVGYTELRKLQEFPKLKAVYVWSTPAAQTKLAELEEKNKNISWFTGYSGSDTVVLQLTPPIIQNEEQIINEAVALQLKHYVNGVEIRYTLDGKNPDSIRSLVYKPGVVIDSNLTVKAKAFKTGWLSSDIIQYHFYKRKFVPDSVWLLSKPNPEYKAGLAQTLNDNTRSDLDQRSGKWVGFQKENLEIVMRFPEPVTTSNITLSLYEDLGAWIFPPQKVEVWGGSSPQNMKLLTAYSPALPKEYAARKLIPLTCTFPASTVKYIKVIARPAILPAWHNDKGKQGHLFIDEIFVN